MGCSLSSVNLLILIGLLPLFLDATGGDSSNKQYGKMPLTEHDVTRGTEIAKYIFTDNFINMPGSCEQDSYFKYF
jgi:hypothetical protein